jgi:hypothetical protein
MTYGKITRRQFIKILIYMAISMIVGLIGLKTKSPLASYGTVSDRNSDNDDYAMDKDTPDFVVGVNVPWFNDYYGRDIGYNQFSGHDLWDWPYDDPLEKNLSSPDDDPPNPFISENMEEVESLFERIRGLDVMRIWLFEQLEGLYFQENASSSMTIMGLDGEMMDNLKEILEKAEDCDMKVYLTLLNGVDTKYLPPRDLPSARFDDYYLWKDSQRKIIQEIIKNPDSFCDAVIPPLLEVLKEYDSVFAIDLVNEPEEMLNGDNALVTTTDMDTFITKCALKIKEVSLLHGYDIRVSVGCQNSETGKKTSNLPIDFVDIHYHKTNDGNNLGEYDISAFNGKECIIGEYGLSNEMMVGELDMHDILEDIKTKGYSGVIVWGLFTDDVYLSHKIRKDVLKQLKDAAE